jgi:hypothetical protein
MMQGQRYWVANAKITALPFSSPELGHVDERKKFDQGQVRLTTGGLGTEIKWAVMSPCLSSIFFVQEWLQDAKTPIILRFYVSGWFEEFYKNSQDAVQRLDEIVARGDRHFVSRTLIKEFSIEKAPLTPLLNDCISKAATAEDYAVECVFENHTSQFLVERIGPKSVISKVWGSFASSFPCQSAGSYGHAVSQAYGEVLNSGRLRYDHVLAAMRMPDNEVFWVPYRRLVMPKQSNSGKPGVLVVSEITPVDIQLI